jgi:hypothetical protein
MKNNQRMIVGILSRIITLLILLVMGVLSMLIQMIALNGVMDNRAMVAMGILFLSQAVVMVLAWKFVGWAFQILTTKFNFNYFPATALAVLTTTGLGAALFFVLIIFSILLAGIK